jgi:muramidase (phage lysozyme)
MADFDPDQLLSERPSSASMKVRPRRAGPRADKNDDDDDKSPLSPTMNEIIDHIAKGESGGRYDVIYGGKRVPIGPDKDHPRIAVPITSGPNVGRTSSAFGGLQFIGSTWDWVAEHTGRRDTSEESQKINGAWLARDTYEKAHPGRDIEADWASGDPKLRKEIDRALGTQWESLAPGPRVSNLDIHGRPRLGFGFSPYAMREHEGRPDTEIQMMSPADYLDLSPKFEKPPFTDPSGKSLMQSFRKGDAIEAIPTLDVEDGKVVDQDGRHRALLAQQEGVPQIPVAVRKKGDSDLSKLTGMEGNTVQLRGPRQDEPRSLFGKVADAVIPRAEAAEPAPPDWMKGAAPEAPTPPSWMTGAAAPPKTVEQMSPEEAQAAKLNPEQQADWMKAHAPGVSADKLGGAVADAAVGALVPGSGLVDPHLGSKIINPDNAAAVTRGITPYALGAGVGAGFGSVIPGLGTGLGAMAGAGAVGLSQIMAGLSGLASPEQASNALLDQLGVRKVTTPDQRVIEQMSSGTANALSGAGAASVLFRTLKTPQAKATLNYLMNKSGSVSDTLRQIAGALAENPAAQMVSGAFSGAGAQIATELGASPTVASIVGLITGLAPGGKGLAPNWRHINASPEAKAAINEGFAITPADASEGHIGGNNITNTLAGAAGKVKEQQLVSAKNQIVVNQKVAKEFGLPEDTPMFPETYEAIRAREAKVYDEVSGAVPDVDLARDPVFVEEVKGLGKRSESTERLFPSTKEPPSIPELRAEMLEHGSAPTSDVMKYIADLRSRATAGFQARGEGAAMAHRKAFAEREAANALEDAMERSVQNAPRYFRERLEAAQKARDDLWRERNDPGQGLPLQGPMIEAADAEVEKWANKLATANAKNQKNQTLLDRFREARRTMAKAYDAEAVTNPSNGNVSATGLGRLKQRGKPLSGALETIADAANNFRRSFQNPTGFGGVEPLSVLDEAFAVAEAAKGAGKLAVGNPGGFFNMLAAASPFMRRFAREGIASPDYQKKMIAPYQNPSAPVTTSPLLPTQRPDQGNALMNMQ